MDHGNTQDPTPPAGDNQDIHHKIGHLTRQLHDALKELGYADQLAATVGELPDAQSRLSYIARLTGDAAEKVLNRVDQAKSHNDNLAAEVREVIAAMVKNPVAAVATGRIMNFLRDVERATQTTDEHLTEIMMAQDFHDLTGQVIARVVTLAGNIEQQLVQLVIETAPPHAIPAPPEPKREHLAGPVVDPEGNPDVVTDQSQVDDLLASLGF
ncbi:MULTISPECIES: protein phosphatase CheZ [Comamonadaceae]|jgi:chemotaxis protein CheZ|uniref:protein phosphatase CheZ n=1 Tax=Comamonadaceae TaxID=80864 RepID=UPI001FA9FF39|nr:protein phosphatase CheZ [Acidovorax sp. W1-6]MCL4771062.1 protein phosphatase CheZ [Burkholderiaceae bacterium]